MKVFIIFLSLIQVTFLMASPAYEAAVLANDAYLPQKQFMTKYSNSAYQLIPKHTDIMQFYIFSQPKQLLVVFEGTKDMAGVHTDLTIGEVEFMGIKKTKVHKGYYQEALQALQGLKPYLSKDKPIVIIGHSLGGAVGHLLASILYLEGYSVHLYTFGAPPVGNRVFVQKISGLHHERYTHLLDIVPKLQKEYIVKLKEALKYVNTKLPENEMMLALLQTIEHVPYDYVHQGDQHNIYNFGSLPKGYDESAWYEQLLTRVRLYHSSKNYVEGLE